MGIVVRKHLSKGEKDFDLTVQEENRYVVLENGIDATGEHHKLQDAVSIALEIMYGVPLE